MKREASLPDAVQRISLCDLEQADALFEESITHCMPHHGLISL